MQRRGARKVGTEVAEIAPFICGLACGFPVHKDELRENWELAAEHRALKKIAPLE
jgi:hypothetical protein